MWISRQCYRQVEQLVRRPSRGYTALSIQMAMFDGILISKLKDFVFVYLHKANLLVALESAFMVLLHGWMLACSVPKSCLTLCDQSHTRLPLDSQPTRLLCPWDFPGKNTGLGCHFLLQGIFPIQQSNLYLLHWQADSLPLSHLGSPCRWIWANKCRVANNGKCPTGKFPAKILMLSSFSSYYKQVTFSWSHLCPFSSLTFLHRLSLFCCLRRPPELCWSVVWCF